MSPFIGLLLSVAVLVVTIVQFVIVQRTNRALDALETRLRAIEWRRG